MSWYVPGRLEVFGTHTDYAGGRSLLAAMNRGVTATTEPGGDGIWVTSTASPDVVQADGPEPLPKGHWGNYARTVVDRLQENFGQLRPATITVDSTLPLASGMSSSSALMVAIALSLADDNNLWEADEWKDNIRHNVDLATYLSTVENGMTFGSLVGRAGVGTFGGSEDHTGMIASKEGHISQFSFCPTTFEAAAAMPEDWAFVVAMSGVLAEKTGAALDAYNTASAQARGLVQRWNQETGEKQTYLADVIRESGNIGRLRKIARDAGLDSRLEAFVTESNVLIPAAMQALRDRDLAGFGQAANLSHKNADEVLGNQIPATNYLQSSGVRLGAAGATSFGAGFGGSLWAVVPAKDAAAFADAWREDYERAFADNASRASFIVARPGPPAHRV